PRRAAIPGVLEVEAALPASLTRRARLWIDGEHRGGAGDLARLSTEAAGGGPYPAGLHQIEWRTSYRGGASHRVGWSQLTGPYQDPAAPPCSVRVLFGQALLDDEADGARTLAHLVRTLAERE